MSLVISRQSWHYRLHSFIRKQWGWDPAPKKLWTLCPYCQATFWGTVITVFAIVPSLIGWLFCRFARKAYKKGSQGGILSFWVNLCDNTGVSSILDKAPDGYKNAFIPSGLIYFSIFFMFSIALCIMTVAATLVGETAMHIWYYGVDSAPNVIVDFLVKLGFWIFVGFGMVFVVVLSLIEVFIEIGGLIGSGTGWLWEKICFGVVWFFNALFTTSTWTAIGSFLLDVGRYLASSVIGYILFFIILLGIFYVLCAFTALGEMLFGKLEVVGNGYSEAREKLLNSVKEDSSSCEDRKPNILDKIGGGIGCVISFVIVVIKMPFIASVLVWGLLVSREIETKDGRIVTQIGPLGVVWKGIVALKKGACPIVEFIDESDISSVTIVIPDDLSKKDESNP